MSLNDNRWGNKSGDNEGRGGNHQGPPDLEDIWRDFNRRLTGLFGGGSGGGGPRVSGRGAGGAIGVIVVGVVLALWAASGFYTVDANERGVVMRFGKYIETTEPGLRWRFPYPFETHEIVDQTGVRTVEVGYQGSERNKVLKEALMLTDDENIINIQFAVQYMLRDPQAFLFNNRDADGSVKQAAETAIREIVGKSKMDFVLYEGREQIAVDAATLMQTILDRYQTGIQISKVTMQNAQPPEQVQEAFNDAVKASQDRERQKNEGQAYANDVIPKARGTSARLLQEANGYRARIIAQAEGDASRFKQVLTEYAKAPQVTRERIYIDTMQQIFSNTSKVMVDTRGNGNLLYLPLDKLMQAAGAAAGAGANNAGSPNMPFADNPAPQQIPETVNNYRGRDSMSSRDRGER